MARWYNFAIARFAAHPARNERLNVGIVVYDDDGLDIYPAKNFDKVRAITSALDSTDIRASLLRLNDLDAVTRSNARNIDERHSMLDAMSAFELSNLGRFEAPSRIAYEAAVLSLMARFVEPEPAPFKRAARRSKLLSSLKMALKEEGVLARRGEDLSAHRVVPSWPLAEGLAADFVLKNGCMHVIETVDAQSDELSARKIIGDIGVSALVLEQARMTFGEGETRARLIYSASAANEERAKPSLRAAENQGAELINWLSADARRSFITNIAQLATPIDRSKNVVRNINASSQRRLSLN